VCTILWLTANECACDVLDLPIFRRLYLASKCVLSGLKCLKIAKGWGFAPVLNGELTVLPRFPGFMGKGKQIVTSGGEKKAISQRLEQPTSGYLMN